MDKNLRAVDVSFRYRDTEPWVLKDVSLLINKGRITALTGPSGSGKSTLGDILGGLMQPVTGSIEIDGKTLSPEQLIRWRDEVGVVPQEGFLFDESIRDNLLCVKPGATDDELWTVLEDVNARAFIEQKPDRLDTHVGERGGLLSGGERQRISIARALLRNPQLLILDEPTNNLDVVSERALLDAIVRLRKKTTLLVITHDEQIVGLADQVLSLPEVGCTRERAESLTAGT